MEAAPKLSLRNQRRSRRAQREQKRKRKRKQKESYTSISSEFENLNWDSASAYPRLTLGSKDSLDLDVVYIFPAKPPVTICYKFCDPPENQRQSRWSKDTPTLVESEQEKEENRNIILVDEGGVVYDCFKGIPDAIHNCIYYTYSLHSQSQPNPCTTLVHRNVPVRVVKGLRDLVGILCKTEKWRTKAKQAIKSNNFLTRRQLLSEVDYEALKEDPCMSISVLKIIAFHFAQMIALMGGKELFTKALLSSHFPDLRCFLYRSEEALTSLPILNSYRDTFLRMTEGVTICQKQDIAIFTADVVALNEKQSWNMFSYQCRGMVIDIKKEFCLSYPFDNYYAIDNNSLPEWPCDDALIEKDGMSYVVDNRTLDTPAWVKEGQSASTPFFTCFVNLCGEVVVVSMGDNNNENNFELPLSIQKLLTAEDGSLKGSLEAIDYTRYSIALTSMDDGENTSLLLVGVRDRHTWNLLPLSSMLSLAERWHLVPYPTSTSKT